MLNLDVFLASNGPCTNWLKIYSSTTWEDVVQDSYQRRKTHSAKRPVPGYSLALILILERGASRLLGSFLGELKNTSPTCNVRLFSGDSLLKYSTFWSCVTSLQFTWISQKTDWSWEIFLHASARLQNQTSVDICHWGQETVSEENRWSILSHDNGAKTFYCNGENLPVLESNATINGSLANGGNRSKV